MSLINFEDLPPCRQDGYDTIHRCVTQFGETEDDEIKFWQKKQLTTDSEYVRCVTLIGDPVKDIIFQFWGGIGNCSVCSIFFPTITIFNTDFCQFHCCYCRCCGEECEHDQTMCGPCIATYYDDAGESSESEEPDLYPYKYHPFDECFYRIYLSDSEKK